MTSWVLCAALIVASPGPGLYRAWASQVAPPAAPVARVLADSFSAYLAHPGNNISGVLTAENQIKAEVFLRQLAGLISAEAANGVSGPQAIGLSQSSENLRLLNSALAETNWHDLHGREGVERVLESLSQQLPKPSGQGPHLETAALISALEATRSLVSVPPVALPGSDNPWTDVFDGIKQRAQADHYVVGEAGLAPRSSPQWRQAALANMVSSQRLSRTTALGRKYMAAGSMSHEEIQEIASQNFRKAAEFVLDNADELPLNLETATKINKILSEGLVPQEIHGNPFYHGNPQFHQEVRSFYKFLGSAEGAALARAYPVEIAERLHYTISFLDAFPDSNGRTGRLMADLALLKAGLAPAFYGDIEDYFARGSMRSGVSLKQRQDYFREVVARGQVVMSDGITQRQAGILRPTLSQTVLTHIETTPGHEGSAIEREPRGSAVEFLMKLHAHPAAFDGVTKPMGSFAKVRAGLKRLPSSLKNFILGVSLLEAVSMGMASTMAVYGISQFGLLYAIIAVSLSVISRIPGSLIAGRLKDKEVNPQQIYKASIVIQVLQILSLPAGFYFFGGQSNAYLLVFMASQFIYGLVFGATVGMAESTIMPKIVGSNLSLETAKSLVAASKMLFALVSAFILGPILSYAVGINFSIVVYGAMAALSLPFINKITLSSTVSSGAQVEKTGEPQVDRLPAHEYLPYIAAMFTVFSFYTVFVGTFALYLFNDPSMMGQSTPHSKLMSFLAIGAWNLGGSLISVGKALPGLMASLGGEQSQPSKIQKMLDDISLKTWFALMAPATAIYLASALSGHQWLNLAATAVLAAVATINRTQWMAYYLRRLEKAQQDKVVSAINSWAVAATFVLYAFLGLSQIFQLSIIPVLAAISAIFTLALVIMWAIVRAQKS